MRSARPERFFAFAQNDGVGAGCLRPHEERDIDEDHQRAVAGADRDDRASGWAVLGRAANPTGRHLSRVPGANGATANWQPVASSDGSSTIVLTFIEIETDEGVTGLGGPVDRARRPISTCLPQHLHRAGPAGDRAAVGHHVPRWRPQPQGHPDVRDQRDRLRALGPARQSTSTNRSTALLGGPTRELPAYASMLGHSLEPDKVEQRGQGIRSQGVHRPEMVPALGAVRWARGHPQERRADGDPARLRGTGERHHDRRLDVLERALHAGHGATAEAVRSALARRAGAARQDRAVRRDPGRLPRPDQRRRARVHPLRHQGAARCPRGRPDAGRHLLGGRHQRDAEDLPSLLRLRHSDRAPRPFGPGQRAAFARPSRRPRCRTSSSW